MIWLFNSKLPRFIRPHLTRWGITSCSSNPALPFGVKPLSWERDLEADLAREFERRLERERLRDWERGRDWDLPPCPAPGPRERERPRRAPDGVFGLVWERLRAIPPRPRPLPPRPLPPPRPRSFPPPLPRDLLDRFCFIMSSEMWSSQINFNKNIYVDKWSWRLHKTSFYFDFPTYAKKLNS